MKLILILTLVSIINAQFLKWESPDLISMTRTLPIYKHKMFETKKLDKSAKLKAAAYSLILPGWGQYKNEEKTAAWIFIGIELASWTAYFLLQNKGDRLTRDVEKYVDDPVNGFSRIQYYDNFYFEEYNSHLQLNGSTDDEKFNQLISNSTLYNELKVLEKKYGDAVHSLPDTKTQQYYEMVGKYNMFYHGWLIYQNTNYFDWRNIHGTPDFIVSYYDLRQRMNDAYNHARIAVSITLINHIVSAIHAYIAAENSVSFSYEKYDQIYKVKMTYAF